MEQPQAPKRRPEAHAGDRQFIMRSMAFSVMVLAVVGLFSHLIAPILPAAFSVMDFLSEFFVLVFVMLGGVLASQVEARRDRIILVAGIIAMSTGTLLDVVDEFGMGWQVRAVGENAASVLGFALFYFGVQDWLRVNKEEYRKVQERNAYLAVHDPLTGLRNRAALLEHLESLIDRARREPAGYRFALLFADLDRFKMVNDTKGHEFGDHLLKQVGQRLTVSVRSTDLCFRLGGDEFVVALPHLHDEGDAYRVAQKLLDSVRTPFHILDDEVRISASVGIAVFPRDGSTPDELQKCADLAMYHAKSLGGGVHHFSRELQTQAEHRATMERDLVQATARGELTLWYEPIVSSDGTLQAVEAVARWNHPTAGTVDAETFMPVAEESGFVHEIGTWMLRTALENLRDEIEPRLPGTQVSVVISFRQLSSRHFVDTVQATLEQTGIDPGRLVLEIAQSAMVHDFEVTSRVLHALSDIGVRCAIDDFTADYTSLRYLQQLPVDIVKLDCGFSDTQDTIADEMEITRGMVGVVTKMGTYPVLKGIRTDRQIAPFAEDCSIRFQGSLFGEPMPMDHLWSRVSNAWDAPD